jgi:hypothetical protein
LSYGYRICLAPGAFVYHEGRGSNIDAGLVTNHGTTVPENEAIIDVRYPQFRDQVDAFLSSHLLPKAQEDAINRIMYDAGRQYGYSVEVGWLPRVTQDEYYVRVHITPEADSATVRLHFRGFRSELECPGINAGSWLRQYFGRDPIHVNMLDRGGIADRLRAAFNPSIVSEVRNYPSQI